MLTGPLLVERLRPLDALRRAALLALGSRARTWVLPRERRVAILGSVAALAALAGTLAAPLVLLALGPLVLGVPHLVADLRYLVTRPGLHRRRAAIAAALVAGARGLALGLGVRAGSSARRRPSSRAALRGPAARPASPRAPPC